MNLELNPNILPVKIGGLQYDQDPADKLKDTVNRINGLSLRHLLEGAKMAQSKTDKPISFSFLPAALTHHRLVSFVSGLV
jgi:hypothetical protein